MLADHGHALGSEGFFHHRFDLSDETLHVPLIIRPPGGADTADAVDGLVSLMDHTPGQRQFRDISKLEDYMKGKQGLSDAEFAEHVAQLKGQSSPAAPHA